MEEDFLYENILKNRELIRQHIEEVKLQAHRKVAEDLMRLPSEIGDEYKRQLEAHKLKRR